MDFLSLLFQRQVVGSGPIRVSLLFTICYSNSCLVILDSVLPFLCMHIRHLPQVINIVNIVYHGIILDVFIKLRK